MNKNFHPQKGWSKTYTIIEEHSKSILFQASTRGPVVEIWTTIKQLKNHKVQVVELCRDLLQYSKIKTAVKLNWNEHIVPILNKKP
jgi:hypothetical protein